jgi:hypothetical protein
MLIENVESRFNALYVWDVGGVFLSVQSPVGGIAGHLRARWCGGMWRGRVIG